MRTRWKTWLGLALIFIAGLAIGVAATLGVIRWRIDTIAAGGPEALIQIISDEATRRANLDETERQKLVEIATSFQREVLLVRRQGADRLQTALGEVKVKLRAALPPAKASKLIDWIDTNDARWERWRVAPSAAPSPAE